MTVHVDTVCVGPLETNCYLAWEAGSKAAVCVDPGGEAARIIAAVSRHGLNVGALLLTHGHGDHLGALGAVRAAWHVPVWIHQADAPMLTSAERNLSATIGMPVASDAAEHHAAQGGVIAVGGITIEILHTPGHTKGSVCYLVRVKGKAALLFSGDTLFRDDVGRHDLPGGSQAELHRSIRERLYVLPDDTEVYPGHGPSTTIGREKRENECVRAA